MTMVATATMPDLSVELEAVSGADAVDGGDDHRVVGRHLPRARADAAVQMSVLRSGQDVELLPPVGAMAVTDDAEILEHVEGPIDGRWDGVRIAAPAAFDELGAGDVTMDLGEHLDEDAPLWRPAQTARAQPVRDAGPRSAEIRGPGGR